MALLDLNFTKHAERRALERSGSYQPRNNLEDYDWYLVRYVDRLECHESGGKYVYCKDLELLGIVSGKKVITVKPAQKSKFEFENGKYNRKKRKSRARVNFDNRVMKEMNDRAFE